MTEQRIFIGSIFVTLLLIIAAVSFMSFQFSGDEPVAKKDVQKEDLLSDKGIHWHARLSLFINGKEFKIPANIGLSAGHLPVHTHQDASDGVIHMEFPGTVAKNDVMLGIFFQNWGKPFSKKQLMEYKTSDGNLTMIVNGKENTLFDRYQMNDGDSIEIRFIEGKE